MNLEKSEVRPGAGQFESWAVAQLHMGQDANELRSEIGKIKYRALGEQGFDGVVAQDPVLVSLARDPLKAQNLLALVRDCEMAACAVTALSDGRVDYWNKDIFKHQTTESIGNTPLHVLLERQIVAAGQRAGIKSSVGRIERGLNVSVGNGR